MTRGTNEWGAADDNERNRSRRHVDGTKQMYAEAIRYYTKAKAEDRLKVIYFDEAGGNHYFPPKVKEEVYAWLDRWLKNNLKYFLLKIPWGQLLHTEMYQK